LKERNPVTIKTEYGKSASRLVNFLDEVSKTGENYQQLEDKRLLNVTFLTNVTVDLNRGLP
jgi:hypothetical protein